MKPSQDKKFFPHYICLYRERERRCGSNCSVVTPLQLFSALIFKIMALNARRKMERKKQLHVVPLLLLHSHNKDLTKKYNNVGGAGNIGPRRAAAGWNRETRDG